MTAGRNLRQASMASRPVGASPTTVMSGSLDSIATSPSRIAGWSSTIRILIGFGGVVCTQCIVHFAARRPEVN